MQPSADIAVPLGARGWHVPVYGANSSAVISRFGDPRDGGSRSHEGIDIGAPRGTPVVAPVGGTVVVSGTRSLGGNVVVLIGREGRYEFVFSHLDRRDVRRGQRVYAGEVLGSVGTTGNAAGGPPHLHFEVRLPSGAVDPYPLIESSIRATRAGQ
jgi:murein DD-endopeptidase MepM/ murein hydrolase activator NlpD